MTLLPVAPLVALCGDDAEVAHRLGFSNVKEMATTLGWYHAKRAGVSVHRADELAVACGFHPLEVWGDEWLHGTVVEKRLRPMSRFREPRWALIAAEVAS